MNSVVGENDREGIEGVLDALDDAVVRVCAMSCESLTTPELLAVLERLERVARRLPVLGHAVINQVAGQASAAELGGSVRVALVERLRISRVEASRRIADAAVLGPRRSLSGDLLEPVLSATAVGQRGGVLGSGHIRVIRDFVEALPHGIEWGVREAAEAQLTHLGEQRGPDELKALAGQLLQWLHPDGDLDERERQRRRSVTLGRQQADGMSMLSGWLTPPLRAALEAVLAKVAAPGMSLPEQVEVDGGADPTVAAGDTRSVGQRQHDGLLAALEALMGAGILGSHRGLPVTLILTASLRDIENAAGVGVSAGGARVPMRDVIAMAGRSNPYLAVFEGAKPLALYHGRRFASTAQRLVLHARDRGCTRPGCSAPAHHSEVHHVRGWATTHRTDIDDLTLACGPDNRLAETDWSTRITAGGHVEWLPPAHRDYGQPRRNLFHHPEKLLIHDSAERFAHERADQVADEEAAARRAHQSDRAVTEHHRAGESDKGVTEDHHAGESHRGVAEHHRASESDRGATVDRRGSQQMGRQRPSGDVFSSLSRSATIGKSGSRDVGERESS